MVPSGSVHHRRLLRPARATLFVEPGRPALTVLSLCRMEEAYEAAIEQLGGLDNAKPKAVYDLLADEFPVLSVQARRYTWAGMGIAWPATAGATAAPRGARSPG